MNVTVWCNDRFELDDVERFDKIILSPGPGVPDEAGLLKAVIRRYAPTKPILGVCLGEHTHCSVAIALEGGEATVEPGVDGLMRGFFSLKLTRYIRKTGEQLLFRAGELLDVGDGFGDRR